jgi:carboxylesterase type B
MLDVLAAARFVQREAHNLGGDPARITAFGESSGATDAQLLAFAPPARGLISGSISESGGVRAGSLVEAVEATTRVAHKVGCFGRKMEDVKACMQGKPTAELVKAEQVGWRGW